MGVNRLLGLAVAVIVLSPASGFGQDVGKVGITTGAPAGIGMIWQVSKKVALRPDFTFSTSSTEGPVLVSSGAGTTNTRKSYGIGISGLFYLHTDSHLRLYVTPRVVFGRAHTKIETGSVLAPGVLKTTANGFTTSGAFGGEYSLQRHFGVYGEAGLSYDRTKSTLEQFETEADGSTNQSWGIRSAVGVIVYF